MYPFAFFISGLYNHWYFAVSTNSFCPTNVPSTSPYQNTDPSSRAWCWCGRRRTKSARFDRQVCILLFQPNTFDLSNPDGTQPLDTPKAIWSACSLLQQPLPPIQLPKQKKNTKKSNESRFFSSMRSLIDLSGRVYSAVCQRREKGGLFRPRAMGRSGARRYGKTERISGSWLCVALIHQVDIFIFIQKSLADVDISAGCQDIDDALHARLLPNGNIEAGVHIADVTHFVHPSTPMDSEAAARGTTGEQSIFLPRVALIFDT